MLPYISAPHKPSHSIVLRGVIFLSILFQLPGHKLSPKPDLNRHQEHPAIFKGQASAGLFLVNVIDTSLWNPPSPDPVGLDYDLGLGRLIVSDSEVDEMGIFRGANIFEASTRGEVLAACSSLSFSNEPAGIAVNPSNGHVFIAQDDHGKIYEVEPVREEGRCSYDHVVSVIDTSVFNSYDIEGLAFGEGKLFIAVGKDFNAAGIYMISPGINEVFDRVSPTGDDEVTRFEVSSLGLLDPEGIGYHSERGTLFIVSRTEKVLVETTLSGIGVATYDLSFTGIQKPSGVAVGPGSQNPDRYSIYISARGIDNDLNPNENDGKIYELGISERIYFPLMSK